MTSEQRMTQAIMQAASEAAKAAVMVVREADNLVKTLRPIHTTSSLGIPALRMPIFYCRATEKYQELCNFETEVNNIFMTNNYNTQEGKRVPIILNWLDWEGLRFMETLNNEEWEKCKTNTGLYDVLSEKLKPQHNEMILSLQYCKLTREPNKHAKESMGHIRIDVNECGYKIKDER